MNSKTPILNPFTSVRFSAKIRRTVNKQENKVREEEMKDKRKARKIVLVVLIGYVIIMLIGYLGISFYYSSHFFEGSAINGIDCSNLTVDQVKDKVIEEINSYTLKIEERGGTTETIMAPQVKLTYVDDNRVDELMDEQEQFKWPLSFSKSKSYEMAANTTFDEAAVDEVMDNMSCFQKENIVEPENARIEETENGYEIVPEVMGTKLDREKVKAAIIDAIEEGKTQISLEELGCYEDPTILSDDENLNAQLESLNKMTAANITYTFGSRSEVVDRSVIRDWLVQGEDGSYTLDTDKVSEYVRQLGLKYDTFGLEHEFTKHDGTKITLAAGGDYGWCINKTATTDALIQAINDGVVESREPVYLYTAKSREENDIGDTYVEISIQEQRMWCYKDGQQIVDTPVVTGNVSRGFDTPSNGVWAIDAKKQDAILEGEGYASPVTFWLPFNGNVGIHDADRWRSEYGGEIYKTNGSHGCVNTPYENAEKIFNAVDIGTAVVVY